jgi:hypothetical protein
VSEAVFPPLRIAELEVESSYDGKSLMTLRFSGNADLRATAAVSQLIAQVHPEAQRRSVSSVKVDLRELEFMNSSCMKAFVMWLQALQEDERGHRYRITFLSAPSRYWQERSLEALKYLAPDWVVIE